jgi:membrane protease subunit HflC
MRLQTYILIALGLLAFVSYNTLYVVQQTQQAIVLQFGEPKRTVQTPGLNWKIPFIQNVIFYETRVLSMVSHGS